LNNLRRCIAKGRRGGNRRSVGAPGDGAAGPAAAITVRAGRRGRKKIGGVRCHGSGGATDQKKSRTPRRGLPKLPPEEQKELVETYSFERIDVRRLARAREENGGSPERPSPTVGALMEIRIKLPHGGAGPGLEERASGGGSGLRASPSVLASRTQPERPGGFKNAMRGEITIIAPFSRSCGWNPACERFRRQNPPSSIPWCAPRKWHRMLASGEVSSRFALAKRVGVDPAMVTRVLKLLQLAREIQEYLATLRTRALYGISTSRRWVGSQTCRWTNNAWHSWEFPRDTTSAVENCQRLRSRLPFAASASDPRVHSGPRLAEDSHHGKE